ncbi:AbrB family transcriptional regulator [Liquorilactobacillus ghanensis]|uniref:AbrB/MazE/SpoVT family DNA-binding domain-containing protein n=1 Tax=Liquorilactobacillus ghanensis TaxID=399370 RepID=UPI0039EC555C
MINGKITKWGNSQGIRLSKDVLSQIGISSDGDQLVNLKIVGNRLIIEKASNESALAERFKGFNADEYFEKLNNKNREIDWGKPVGNEIW